MTHCVWRNQAVGTGGSARDVAIDRRAAGHYARVVRVVSSYLAQAGQSNWAVCLADRQTVVAVGVPTLMRQVVGSSGVSATDRTLLEMAFQNVTARESVLAQVTGVRSVASVCLESVYYAS